MERNHAEANTVSSSSSTTLPSPPFDLITNLENYPHILENIFCYLRPKDLRIVPCISVSWCNACYHLTPKANRRRLKSIKHLKKVKNRVGMENWPLDCECATFKRRLRNQQNDAEPPRQPQIRQMPARTAKLKRKKLGAIQNIVTANHKFSKYKKPLDSESELNNALSNSKPEKKKPRWILAQEPFKKW